ncbi:hypothetical protein FN846DRAFT_910521 [Sphaerosporella brunnea]|uniref:Uncharacterized protein n=1 Tax=Sphaerosporella brunnea TaxID=1250544 RepID=A0A5J5ELJ7_9PEZI|nr:hypothetical protein FN846DRAFT_910521 [Sphaerosporella brunnea]
MPAAPRLPTTAAEFHALHPNPPTVRNASRKVLGASGSEFHAYHLLLYRVLEQRHPRPSAAAEAVALHPRLDAALRMFRRTRALLTARPFEFVDSGGFHVFYSLLAKVLKAGERVSAPALGVVQRRAPAAAGLWRRRTEFVSGSGLGLSSPSVQLPSSSPYSMSSDLASTASAHMDTVGPEALTQHLVSAFLTVVLDMRDRPPPRRLVFWPTPHRMTVDTWQETFVCIDDGGFALDGRDDRRYASLECKRQWAAVDAADGSVRLEEPLNVAAQHVAEFLGMAADNQPTDGAAWEDVRRRFFLVVGNQHHLQLKRVDFTPDYLRYVMAEPEAHQPVPSSPPARRDFQSSPIEGSLGNWPPPSGSAGSSSAITTPCRQAFITSMVDSRLSDWGEQEQERHQAEADTVQEQIEQYTDGAYAEHKVHDDDEPQLPRLNTPRIDDEPQVPRLNTDRIDDSHRDLPFMTIHSGPIHNLATPQGRVAAAKEILALAEEIESWM